MNGAPPDGSAATAVLVVFESTPIGRGAVARARELADGAGLVVLTVLPEDEAVVGCGSCRQSAALWNRQMRRLAAETHRDAVSVADESPAVRYEVARGPYLKSVADAARRCDARVIVLADRQRGPLRRLLFRDPAERLRQQGEWDVVISTRQARRTREIE